jgi:hypothetical protein
MGMNYIKEEKTFMAAKKTTPTSKLDLLHKGIYPALGIALALFTLAFAFFQWTTNTDKQRQIDNLQIEMRSQREQMQKVEDEAQGVRLEIQKNAINLSRAYSDPKIELKPEVCIRTAFLLLCSNLQMLDEQRIGKDKAKDLWAKAKKQAEEETLDWRP